MSNPQSPIARQKPLAAHASAYERGQMDRPQGDPLGLRGLPRHRAGLDGLVRDLVATLQAAGHLRSCQLVAALGIDDARALRLLVAYTRVHHGRHEIIGIPGEGYLWGESPEAQLLAAKKARRMARCYLFISTLHQRQGVAMSAVGMLFDMMEYRVDRRPGDDLSALLAADGASIADALEVFLRELAKTDDGQKVIADVVARNREIVLSESAVAELLGDIDALRRRVSGLTRQAS